MNLSTSILVLDACIIGLAVSHIAQGVFINRLYKRLIALELTVFSMPSTRNIIETIIEHKQGGGTVETRVH